LIKVKGRTKIYDACGQSPEKNIGMKGKVTVDLRMQYNKKLHNF
jgi:hypothetical protein